MNDTDRKMSLSNIKKLRRSLFLISFSLIIPFSLLIFCYPTIKETTVSLPDKRYIGSSEEENLTNFKMGFLNFEKRIVKLKLQLLKKDIKETGEIVCRDEDTISYQATVSNSELTLRIPSGEYCGRLTVFYRNLMHPFLIDYHARAEVNFGWDRDSELKSKVAFDKLDSCKLKKDIGVNYYECPMLKLEKEDKSFVFQNNEIQEFDGVRTLLFG